MLKIGDKLYRYVSLKGIWDYNVVGVRKYDKVTQYELECPHCNHGYNCKLLVVKVDKQNKYKYVCMLNDDENDSQYMWHNDRFYYVDKIECFNEMCDETIRKYKNEIDDHKAAIERGENRLKEMEIWREEQLKLFQSEEKKVDE